MKLFRVTIEVDAFVVAESEQEACDHAREITGDVHLPDYADAVEVSEYPKGSGKIVMASGWDDKCLVYGTDKDTTVAEAVQQYVFKKAVEPQVPGCDGEDMMPVEGDKG